MMRLRRAAPALVLFPLLALMCATATEINVDIYSDVLCSKNAQVGLIMGGKLTDLETNALSSTAVNCDDTTHRVGRVVIAPSGDNDEEIALQVITRDDDQGLETCTAANNYQGCIVARRQLHFQPHTALDVRVDLRTDCLDQPCEPTSTCIHGGCFQATCPADGCASDAVLAPGFEGGVSLPPEAGPNETSVPEAAPPITTLDAGSKCAPLASNALKPQPVANTGSAILATGFGIQKHLVFAENDCRYWYFWIDGNTQYLYANVSSDLTSWSGAGSIPLGNDPRFVPRKIAGADGGNFSIAYLNIGGVDTFHAVIDQPTHDDVEGIETGYPFDVRFTLNGEPGATTLSAPDIKQLVPNGYGLHNGDCDPTDGPSVAIGNDGRVYVASGWYYDDNAIRRSHCDMNVFVSSASETGKDTDWAQATFAWKGYFVTADYTNAHLLLPLTGQTNMFGAFPEPEAAQFQFTSTAWLTNVMNWDGGFDAGDGIPRPDGYGDQSTDGGSIFHVRADNDWAGSNDWNLCATTNSDGHALRRLASGLFEARSLYPGGWSDETAPNKLSAIDASAPPSGVYGGGLVIMGDGNATHGLTAFVADSGATVIKYSNYGTEDGWTSWKTLAGPTAAAHNGLAGTGCSGAPHPVLTWTETTGATTSIVAMDVSSVFTAK